MGAPGLSPTWFRSTLLAPPGVVPAAADSCQVGDTCQPTRPTRPPGGLTAVASREPPGRLSPGPASGAPRGPRCSDGPGTPGGLGAGDPGDQGLGLPCTGRPLGVRTTRSSRRSRAPGSWGGIEAVRAHGSRVSRRGGIERSRARARSGLRGVWQRRPGREMARTLSAYSHRSFTAWPEFCDMTSSRVVVLSDLAENRCKSRQLLRPGCCAVATPIATRGATPADDFSRGRATLNDCGSSGSSAALGAVNIGPI